MLDATLNIITVIRVDSKDLSVSGMNINQKERPILGNALYKFISIDIFLLRP